MQELKTYLFLLIILFSCLLYANGGPIDMFTLEGTGNITFVKKASIELLKEDLFIKIDGNKAHFNVRYIFKNRSEKEKISFAFPITVRQFSSYLEPGQKFDEEMVYGYTLTVNGNKKNHSRKYEIAETEIKEWFISEIEFEKEKETVVSIKYTVYVSPHMYSYSCSAKPALNKHFIFYDFYPASYFGINKVGELNVNLDVSNIKGTLHEIKGLEFKSSNKNIKIYHGKNVDFTKIKKLEISYDLKDKDKYEFYNYQKVNLNELEIVKPKMRKSVSNKMFDFNKNTYTCLNDGEISFVFPEKYLPGFMGILFPDKKRKDYQVKATVIFVDKEGVEKVDSRDMDFTTSSSKNRVCDYCGAYGCSMEEKKNSKYLMDSIDDVFDLAEYDETGIKECRVKINIKSLNPKDKHICISELIFLPHVFKEKKK